ncbi:MAG: YbgC/FadM family acyl-CoA thioesterase [Gammaproteobacteria bacterium]|nr:YbgC/FadM family acyl-CoA thioesterase [Gammaproteobacteria bacterium]
MSMHEFGMRIYIEDTDASGIVYHPNYLSYFSRARTEWLCSHGISLQSLLQQEIIFPVCTVEVAYRRPLVMDDEIIVYTDVIEAKKCSMVFLQKIYRKNEPHNLICEAKIKVACVDAALKPKCMPSEILKIIDNIGSQSE